jgi:protein SCO1/2
MGARCSTGMLVMTLLAASGQPVYAQRTVPPVLSQVRIDQRLDEQLPLDAVFRDETGKSVKLQDYFGRRPVILSFAYYTCPMLCPMTLEGMVKAMRTLSFQPGADYVAVNVSINPKETPEIAAAKKEDVLRDFDRPGVRENWHFLTGDELAIRQVADAAGFRYVWDPSTQQFIHASGIMVVTPQGKMSRYFYGIEYAPRDLRLGLIEATAGKIGSPVDQVLLYCFHYDPATGKYGLVVMNVLRIFGALTVLLMGGAILIYLWRERRKRHAVS